MNRFTIAASLLMLTALSVRADGYWAGEGYVVPKDGVTLRVRSTQLVSKVLKDIGDSVKKGDILMQFDDKNAKIDMQIAQLNLKKKELELRLALARADVAKTVVVRAQIDFERIQKLANNGANAVSKEELAKAEGVLASAKAELTATEVQVELARIDVDTAKAFLLAEEVKLEELRLCAPFDGTIVARYAAVGEWISKPDQGLIDIVGTTYLIEAPIPSRLVSTLKDTTPIEIAVDEQNGERTFKVKVALIAPVIDPRNKSIKVQFTIPDAERKALKPGTLVTVKIGTKKDEE
jgi:RND family efflux transporter MFP subunit